MGDEVLGRGGGEWIGSRRGGGASGSDTSTVVFLADCNGLNAAVKVLSFKDDAATEPEESHHGHERRRGCGFQHESNGVEAKHEEKYEVAYDQQEGKITTGDSADGHHGRGRGRCRREAFVREIETLKRLRGPRIATIYGAVGNTNSLDLDTGPLLLAMELLPGGNLRRRLNRAVPGGSGLAPPLPLNAQTLWGIVKDVCSGIAFLHAEAFVHGGLSATNVLLDAKGRAKVLMYHTRCRGPAGAACVVCVLVR